MWILAEILRGTEINYKKINVPLEEVFKYMTKICLESSYTLLLQ